MPKKVESKTEEMPEGLNLFFKWLFLILGVPSLSYIFLWTSIEYTFETAKTGLQIFMGISLFVILIGYIYFSIKYLIEETKEYFK
ncbi:MAG: hypothetical protein KKB62_01795 [Nanoarchaeota archaeon]|nr:hypothetical protein [Nanoarchaeota archaeon]